MYRPAVPGQPWGKAALWMAVWDVQSESLQINPPGAGLFLYKAILRCGSTGIEAPVTVVPPTPCSYSLVVVAGLP